MVLAEMAILERADASEIRALIEPLRHREDVRDWVENALDELQYLERVRAH